MIVCRHRLWVVFCTALCLGLFSTAASAGLVSTEQVAAPAEATAAREHVKALAQRPELAKELEALGVPPAQAQARLDAMTDAEVLAIAGKLDSLPAGGALSNNELIIVLLLIIILALAL